jgi:hypothetical protein
MYIQRMKYTIRFNLIMLFILFSFQSTAQLLNGSFENGQNPDLSNWNWTCGAESNNNAPSGAGNYCIKVLAGAAQGQCIVGLAYQKIPSITNGQIYILSGFAFDETTSKVGLYFGKIKNGIITLQKGDSTSSTTWIKINIHSGFALLEGDTAVVALTSGFTAGPNVGYGYFDSISLKPLTGISSIGKNNPIKIYPNPFTTYSTLESSWKNQSSNCTFFLYNIFGQQVRKTEIKNERTKIQRENLSTGVYFLKLFTGNSLIETCKLIITD